MKEIELQVDWGWALFQETTVIEYIRWHMVIHIMFHTIGYKEDKRNSGE